MGGGDEGCRLTWGPWMPLLVVIVMSVSVYSGCFWIWFEPADGRCSSSSLGASSRLLGRFVNVRSRFLSL